MRTINEIYEALKHNLFELSGYGIAEGGDMSLRLMAVAAEIFSLEAQCDFAKRQAFPQTASGEYLEHHALVRAISRRQAMKAGGKLKFSLSSPVNGDIQVAAGTQCMNYSGTLYETLEDATIKAGELSCLAAAAAVNAGEEGNCPAGRIVRMRRAPAGVSSVTNPEAFSGGSDIESDDELRSRVIASYKKLPNGANGAYYESLALSIPGVEKVLVLPRSRGRGTVDIVFSAVYGVPSAELVEEVRTLITKCREVCVDVDVYAPSKKTVDISAALTLKDGYDFENMKAKAEEALSACFGGDKLGENLYKARLSAALMSIEGVENCSISVPAADVLCGADELPMPGSISISQAV